MGAFLTRQGIYTFSLKNGVLLRNKIVVIIRESVQPPMLDFPTLEKPTLENPTQLNKDILTKEKPNTDLIKYLFPSYPFPNPSPLEQGIAAEPPERKRMKQKQRYPKYRLLCYAVERHF